MDEILLLDLGMLETELDEDIPACWPNRPGDAQPFTIFRNVGHALTRWERVEASLLETLVALQNKSKNNNKIIRSYSRRRDVQQKIQLIISEFKKQSKLQDNLNDLESKYALTLRDYLKLKIARNRLAHGTVIVAGPVMMDEVENGMIQTYQLHPSEGDQRNWMIPWQQVSTPKGDIFREGGDDGMYINDGPIFSYMAKDIEVIANMFLKLDRDFIELTKLFIADKPDFEDLIFPTCGSEVDMSV